MKVILASQSPRRKELLALIGIPFEVIIKEVDESFPTDLGPVEAVRFIAEKKAKAFLMESTDKLIIAADTIVTIDGKILGKPSNGAHAADMLNLLSGKKHEVITAVALLQSRKLRLFHEVTAVYFKELTAGEIDYYIQHYKPFDKAGGYGIQEWIGAVAIEKIVGSYTNVVGLPTARLYSELGKLDELSASSISRH
ncbi:Maf family protein [Parapedobacter tibetensis]|uniref:Maf family protein n=1 Tax=Parapedobacter tibetensis TaxID=2972951 RepID=UPI00214DBF72|nr:Maf family nucleotide pyrophosphatase [Parapedobacter tibetensis]